MKVYRIVGILPKFNKDLISYIESLTSNQISAGDLFLFEVLSKLGLDTRNINSFYENAHYGTYATKELAEKAIKENKPYDFSYLEKHYGYRFFIHEEKVFE